MGRSGSCVFYLVPIISNVQNVSLLRRNTFEFNLKIIFFLAYFHFIKYLSTAKNVFLRNLEIF